MELIEYGFYDSDDGKDILGIKLYGIWSIVEINNVHRFAQPGTALHYAIVSNYIYI